MISKNKPHPKPTQLISRLQVDSIQYTVGTPIIIDNETIVIKQIVECEIDKRQAFRIFTSKDGYFKVITGPHKYIIDYAYKIQE